MIKRICLLMIIFLGSCMASCSNSPRSPANKDAPEPKMRPVLRIVDAYFEQNGKLLVKLEMAWEETKEENTYYIIKGDEPFCFHLFSERDKRAGGEICKRLFVPKEFIDRSKLKTELLAEVDAPENSKLISVFFGTSGISSGPIEVKKANPVVTNEHSVQESPARPVQKTRQEDTKDSEGQDSTGE